MAILKNWLFLRKWEDKPYTKAVKQDVLVNFAKIQQISDNFLLKVPLFRVHNEDEPYSRSTHFYSIREGGGSITQHRHIVHHFKENLWRFRFHLNF